MGKFAPVLLAFLLNCTHVFLFTNPKELSITPLVCYSALLATTFIILRRASLLNTYECPLPQVLKWSNFMIEFLIYKLLMEIIKERSRLPVEILLLVLIPKLSNLVADFLNSNKFKFLQISESIQLYKIKEILLSKPFLIATFVLSIIFIYRILSLKLLWFRRPVPSRTFTKNKKILVKYRRKNYKVYTRLYKKSRKCNILCKSKPALSLKNFSNNIFSKYMKNFGKDFQDEGINKPLLYYKLSKCKRDRYELLRKLTNNKKKILKKLKEIKCKPTELYLTSKFDDDWDDVNSILRKSETTLNNKNTENTTVGECEINSNIIFQRLRLQLHLRQLQLQLKLQYLKKLRLLLLV